MRKIFRLNWQISTIRLKVIRALVHFDLVKVYGMPYIRLKVLRLSTFSLTNHWIVMHNPDVTRWPDVYAKVVADLNNAIDSEALVTVSKKQVKTRLY